MDDLLHLAMISRCRIRCASAWLAILLTDWMNPGASAQDNPVGDPESGFFRTTLSSKHQAGPASVDILLPEKLENGRKYSVIYILPVGGPGGQFGDGMQEAKKADIANKYDVICVQPFFTAVPWCGNHATDPQIQQEKYLLEDVVPFIDANYPTRADREGRWLIGFSKSGWGAFTLLFRNPEVFGFAAAWDAPLMLDGSGKDWGPMGLKKVFGTKEAMLHFLPTQLATDQAAWLKERSRVVLAPGKHWKQQVEKYHEHLTTLDIPHVYRADLVLEHRWDSGWFAPVAEELAGIAGAP